MQTKESWFPKFKPYQGDLDTTPVQTDEYLPAGKSIILGFMARALAMATRCCWPPDKVPG